MKTASFRRAFILNGLLFAFGRIVSIRNSTCFSFADLQRLFTLVFILRGKVIVTITSVTLKCFFELVQANLELAVFLRLVQIRLTVGARRIDGVNLL